MVKIAHSAAAFKVKNRPVYMAVKFCPTVQPSKNCSHPSCTDVNGIPIIRQDYS